MWDLPRDQTCSPPCIGRRILAHCTTREVHNAPLKAAFQLKGCEKFYLMPGPLCYRNWILVSLMLQSWRIFYPWSHSVLPHLWDSAWSVSVLRSFSGSYKNVLAHLVTRTMGDSGAQRWVVPRATLPGLPDWRVGESGFGSVWSTDQSCGSRDARDQESPDKSGQEWGTQRRVPGCRAHEGWAEVYQLENHTWFIRFLGPPVCRNAGHLELSQTWTLLLARPSSDGGGWHGQSQSMMSDGGWGR